MLCPEFGRIGYIYCILGISVNRASSTSSHSITPDDWKASIKHVTREFEAKYWQKYNISQLSTLMHHNYTPFIVN